LTDLGAAIEAGLAALDPDGLQCALVGGFAVSVRTEPRFTRDIDLVVAVPDDASAEELIRRMVLDGHSVLASVEQAAVGRLATSRLKLKGGQVLDLLFASSGIEPEIVAAADPLEVLPGVTVPVATVGHLIALKLLARDDAVRPQDAGDLRSLMAVADDSDIAQASEAVETIEQRGFARGRDLVNDLSVLAGR
jgi:predicted nucleotidyltransferase